MCMFFLCIFCIFKFWFVSSLLAGLFSKREREKELRHEVACMEWGGACRKWGRKKHDHNIIWIFKTKIPNAAAGEIAQWSGELPTLADEEGPIFSTNMVAYSHLYSPIKGLWHPLMVSAYTWHLYGAYTHVDNHSYI